MSAQSPKSRLGRNLILIVVVIALVAVAVFYELRPTARVVAVWRGRSVDAKPGSVTVEPGYELDLKADVGGRVMDSVIEPGKQFAKGDYMAQFDTRDLDIDIESAQNDYNTLKRRIAVGSQIELEYENAAAKYAIDQHLLSLGQAAQTDIDSERRSLESTKQRLELEQVNNDSQLETDKIAIEQKQLERDRMTIKAPFDGVVSEVLARPGALIPGGAGVAHFITTTRTVEARISEENFAGIAVGDKATVNFLGYNNTSFNATVSKVLPTAEAATQRYVVYLDVDIPVERLTPGLTGEVSIVVDTHPDVLLVPRRALLGNTLFVVNHGQVEVRTVKHGYMGLNEVEITDGVQEGDLVIVQDIESFSEGQHVRTETVPN